MKKSFRIICLVLAIAFAASMLISIVCSIALADGMDTRGETVYVETDAEGNVLSMISSVYITNMSGADTVTDDTTLTNIKNVLGSEAPAIDGTKATFKAEGEDVCYQGEASGELPFTLTLSYYLNGVKMSPKEIAGKSGRVRIEVECKSTLKRPVTVDGVEKELNVPFSVIGMMTLDEGCTGLASDAKISSQDEINEASSALYKGARRLRNGASTLNDGISEYIDGVTAAADGMGQIKDGAEQLNYGAGEVAGGMGTFAASISEIVAKVDEAKAKLDELQNPSTEVDARIIAILESELNKALAGKEEEIKEKVRQSVYDALSGTDLTEEEKRAIADQAAAAVNIGDVSINIDPETANAIRMAVLELDDVKKAIAKLNEIIAKADEAAAGAEQLSSGAYQVSSGMDKLYRGIKELDEGMALLSDNGEQLKTGIKQLYRGLDTLTDGLRQVSSEGMAKIVEETNEIQLSLSKKDALLALSESYTAFSSNAENINGTVQFLITTEAIVEPLPIEMPSPSPEDTTGTDNGTDADAQVENKSFFQAIGEWFANAFAAIRGLFD